MNATQKGASPYQVGIPGCGPYASTQDSASSWIRERWESKPCSRTMRLHSYATPPGRGPPSSRGVLSPSLLALLKHFVQIRTWSYLERSTLHSRMLGNELNCVIRSRASSTRIPPNCSFRFRVRIVCHCNLSVLPIHGQTPSLERDVSGQERA
jgi:hypothetical protein